MNNDYIIIDGHTHIYKDDTAEKIIRSFTDFHQMNPKSVGHGTVGAVQTNMEVYNIHYTVMANFATAKYVFNVNEWTLSLAATHKELIPLVSIYPGMPVDLIEHYVKQGAKGIKMHTGIQLFTPDDERLHPIYEYCNKRSIPITFHCGETSKVHLNDLADIHRILPVVQMYPKIPFILTHMASGDPKTVYEIAHSFPNAYFDTSITVTGEHCIDRIHDDFWEDNVNVSEAFQEIGCHRIIFGSDYPFGNPGSDIKRIMSLELSEQEKRQLLGLNAKKIYRIKE